MQVKDTMDIMIIKQDSAFFSYPSKKFPVSFSSDNPLQRLDPNIPMLRRDSKPSYPIPKGDSAYSKAKRAEYIEKNLKSAERYYKLAIQTNDRAESAIKDLAGVMHQQGKTMEAIDFLKQHRVLFTQDPSKYENLLTNLRRQIVQRGNRLNKHLKISNLPEIADKNAVIRLFAKPERILEVDIFRDTAGSHAIVQFSSHSAARKTLESFVHFDLYKVEWFSVCGDVAGDVLATKPENKSKEKPVFCIKVFCKDLYDKSLVMPLGNFSSDVIYEFSAEEAKNLLGSSLLIDFS